MTNNIIDVFCLEEFTPVLGAKSLFFRRRDIFFGIFLISCSGTLISTTFGFGAAGIDPTGLSGTGVTGAIGFGATGCGATGFGITEPSDFDAGTSGFGAGTPD